jgi:hypothetical protein
MNVGLRRTKAKIPHDRHRRLLRPCRQRPRRSGTTEKGDQLAAPDMICHPILPAEAMKRRTISRLELGVCDVLHPKPLTTALRCWDLLSVARRELSPITRDIEV